MVEQRTENPRVTGSIPVGTTKNKPNIEFGFFVYIAVSPHIITQKKHLTSEVLFVN